MPACEPTDEKLRRKNYKAIGLGTKVALFVVRPRHTRRFPDRGSSYPRDDARSSASRTTSEADSFDEVVHSPGRTMRPIQGSDSPVGASPRVVAG